MSQTTDRELLEAAAKAVGLNLKWGGNSDSEKGPIDAYCWIIGEGPRNKRIGDGEYWNPLEDDGDALRLAVKLRITIQHDDPAACCAGWASTQPAPTIDGIGPWYRKEWNEGDSNAATRRAIVLAAAALGGCDMSDQAERAKFEAWFYASKYAQVAAPTAAATQACWDGWQARAALAQPAAESQATERAPTPIEALREMAAHVGELSLSKDDADATLVLIKRARAAIAQADAQQAAKPAPYWLDKNEKWCLHCDKDDHRTTECWSTYGLNTPQDRELARLCMGAQPAAEPVAPDDQAVICPRCACQFRAIPVDVQRLMLDAGFEPPFKAPPAQPAAEPLTNLATDVVEGYKAGLAGGAMGFVSAAFDCGWTHGAQDRAAQPAAEPLSDAEIALEMLAVDDPLLWGRLGDGQGDMVRQFARAVIAAHEAKR